MSPGHDRELVIDRLTKTYTGKESDVEVLAAIDLTIDRHEVMAVIGPSGCGKSTLLDIAAGLVPPTSGEIRVRGRVVCDPDPDCGIVFQDGGLLPWMTAEGNLRFALRCRRVPAREWESLAGESLARFGLAAFARMYPHQLSGGMKQRLALARALITRPRLLLLDEPFAAVDAITRGRLQEMLVAVIRTTGQTVLLVTHSIDEALILADRVVILTNRPAKVRKIVAVEGPAGPERLLNPAVMALRAEIGHELAQVLPPHD